MASDIPIDACVLCLESLAGGSPHDHAEGVSGVTALPCTHANHTACLKRWERRQLTCPACRAGFDRFLNPEHDDGDVSDDGSYDAWDHVEELTLLAAAAQRGDDAEVARMLAAGVNVHDHDGEALWLAAYEGHDAVVARLLAAGANVHAHNDYALISCAGNGHDTVVARLLAAGANVHADGDEPLHQAAKNGHDAVVARLLAAGANVHALDDEALRATAENGHDAVVALLRAAQ